MQQINQIEAKDIKRLDGSQLVRLLHALLCAEARSRNIGKAGIHVPFEINVKDGGSDGQWNGEIAANDYIPDKLTFYQSKAQELRPADCAGEIHQENSTELKSQVQTVLDAGGAYVFFCSHPYNPNLIKPRIKKAREALKDAGRATWETDKLFFLDATLIAQWVNQHASALAYVCRCTGIWQAIALRDYQHWKDDPLFDFGFQSNENLAGFISDIRATLIEPRGIARITGPSGLGKTRLGFEVFHSETGKGNEKIRECLAASVVYLDMQIHGREVRGWVNQLALGGYSGVIVVDNCSRPDHNILQNSIRHPDCQLSLLTLDYVPEAPYGDALLQVQLTPEIMRDVVPKILAAVPGLKEKLGAGGIQRVSEFAHGFPQIAILTAKTGHALNLSTLNQQGDLANRLLWGWGEEDAVAKEIIRCLAPFTEIGWTGSFATQIEFVRNDLCKGLSDYDFRRHTKQFIEKRVLQEVGDFLMVVPAPLGAALAADWLEDVSDDYFQELLPKIGACGLTDSFCRRLQQLDFSPRAQALCEKLMGPTGPFASAEALNSESGSEVFRALSEVNSLAATDCLHRLTSGWSSEKFVILSIGRRNLVWTLEKLVWDTDTFPKAARVLRGFAAGETEHWANNATNQFCQLFHIFLPGTQCPLAERLEIIEEGLVKKDRKIQGICIDACGSALTSGQFTRSGGSEQRGSQLPRFDYRPAYKQEIWNYWKAVFLILKRLILEFPELSEKAAATLGSKLGAILTCPLIKELESEFKSLCNHQSNYWPSARDELKRVLSYFTELPASNREIVERWLKYLTPSDLRTRLVDVVSLPGWQHEERSDGGFRDLAEEGAINLAQEYYESSTQWISHVDVLLLGDQQQTWAFGARCMAIDGKQGDLFNSCLKVFKELPPEKRNPQLLRGMINSVRGTPLAAEILDRVAADSSLRSDLLVPLSTAAATNADDFQRVTVLVQSQNLPPTCIEPFAYGGISIHFDSSEFVKTLSNLVESIPSASPSVLRLVSAFYHRDSERFATASNLVEGLVLMTSVIEQTSNTMMGHYWETAVNNLLNNPPKGFVKKLANVLASEAASKNHISIHKARPLILAMERLLKEHWKEAWPVFREAVRDKKGRPRFALVDLLCQGGRLHDSGAPLWALPPEEFRTWAESNPDLLPYVLNHIPLFTVERTASVSETTQGTNEEAPKKADPPTSPVKGFYGILEPDERYVWHPFARIVVELCGKQDLLGSLAANIFSFTSSGSRIPYLIRRKELIADLTCTEDAELKSAAESIIRQLDMEIADEKKEETQRAAGIYAR